jgi:hypothetical protein
MYCVSSSRAREWKKWIKPKTDLVVGIHAYPWFDSRSVAVVGPMPGIRAYGRDTGIMM